MRTLGRLRTFHFQNGNKMFDDSLPFSQPITSVIKVKDDQRLVVLTGFFYFPFQYFFNIFLLFCCFLKCIYFILFSFSRYGFIIITIIIILVVKIFISFVIYILLTIFFKLQHKSGQILCENARSPYLTDDICYLENICRTEQLFIS